MKSRVNQLIDWVFERWEITQPTLVATVAHDILWYEDDEDPDEDDGHLETLTFYLMEYPSGRRDYRFDIYGTSAEHDYQNLFMSDVMAWVYGGPLPEDAKRPQTKAEVITLVQARAKPDKEPNKEPDKE